VPKIIIIVSGAALIKLNFCYRINVIKNGRSTVNKLHRSIDVSAGFSFPLLNKANSYGYPEMKPRCRKVLQIRKSLLSQIV